ncbi:DedA family protein [Mucisphaera calidilacus]|uniref:VTT domain-containing protein n=1 Tax=Mucisphaera calidilacus TaxID=2527982 RepID=A0A518BUJ9_9BACT|nr:DedA family protein [Mucisphaera calidilacus]QDU70660.1 hypothetical protein Pan265_04900 [Mucisphaera calidilacus]
MEAWLEQLAANAPYIVLAAVLLASGFGLPIPEDLPLFIGGYLAGHDYAQPLPLFLVCFAAIMTADGVLFWLGRTCGHHVPRLPLLNRFLTDERVAKYERNLEQHGGKFIFVGRFIPGVRAPVMFAAGALKVPYWKFILFDATAATVSATAVFWLSFYFAEQIEQVRVWILEGQIILAIVALTTCTYLALRWRRRHRAWLQLRERRQQLQQQRMSTRPNTPKTSASPDQAA